MEVKVRQCGVGAALSHPQGEQVYGLSHNLLLPLHGYVGHTSPGEASVLIKHSLFTECCAATHSLADG